MPGGYRKGDFLFSFGGGCGHHRFYQHLYVPVKKEVVNRKKLQETAATRLKIDKIPDTLEEGGALIKQFSDGFGLTLIGMSISLYHKVLTGGANKQGLESDAADLQIKLASSNVNAALDKSIKELCNIIPKFVLKTTLQLAAIELHDQISKLGIRAKTEEELKAEAKEEAYALAKEEAYALAKEKAEALASDLEESPDWVLIVSNEVGVEHAVDGNALAQAGLLGEVES